MDIIQLKTICYDIKIGFRLPQLFNSWSVSPDSQVPAKYHWSHIHIQNTNRKNQSLLSVCPPQWIQNRSTFLQPVHYRTGLQSVHHHDYRTVPQFYSLFTHHDYRTGPQFYSLTTTMTTEQVHSSIVWPPPWLQNRSTVLQSVNHHNYRTGSHFCSLSPTMTTEQFHSSTVCQLQ